jgi:hypothetical protein
MNDTLVELEKKVLIQNYQRLLNSTIDQKITHLEIIWNIVHTSIVFISISENAKSKYLEYWQRANGLIHAPHPHDIPKNESERFYTTYYLLQHLLRKDRIAMVDIGRKYNKLKTHSDEENFQIFNNLFLEHFIFYYLNLTDKHNFILALLKRYKLRTEWFNREELFSKWESNKSKGELILKKDLYKFLFDQGLDIFLEPSQHSGKPDFIAIERSNLQKSVLEGKIFHSQQHSKSHLIEGVKQTEIYVRDRNEQIGYLVVYNTGPQLIVLALNADGHEFPFIIRNGRKIYLLIVDVYSNEKSASIRPREQVITFTKEDFE